MSETWDLLMVGLPDSGKSTFLGALFHALKDREEDGLRLEGVPDERDYLIELENAWLSLQPVGRSSHQGPKNVELTLRDDRGDQSLSLVIPDIVGEDYEEAWEHGEWNEEVVRRLTSTDGLLLFVRADDIREPVLLDVGVKENADTSTPGLNPWEPAAAPTQAKLCDLLEQITETRGGDTPPIAVVVAAWDTVAEVGLSPHAWLEWQTPLLWQWLSAQEPAVTYRVFGISAQGGDLRQEEVRTALAQNATRRPLPPGADALTTPLRWLLEERHQ
jgi:hypothetical protein